MRIMVLILLAFSLSGAGSWERAMDFVFAHEGGYCHDGGWESNYGLCSKWYPGLNMKTLSRDSAEAIYYRDYWQAMGCDIQPDSNFALLIFDTAVLFGQPTANAMLRNCYYSKESFLILRWDEIASIIIKHPKKARYLATWMKRTSDLQMTVFNNH